MIQEEERSLLVIGAPEHDADAYHLSGFLAPDAVICLRVAGKTYLTEGPRRKLLWTGSSPTTSSGSSASPAS
jgi:hypothetical protein